MVNNQQYKFWRGKLFGEAYEIQKWLPGGKMG